MNYVRLDSLGKRIRRQSFRCSRFGLVDFDRGEIVWTLVRVLDLLWIEFVLDTTSGTFGCFGVGSVLGEISLRWRFIEVTSMAKNSSGNKQETVRQLVGRPRVSCG